MFPEISLDMVILFKVNICSKTLTEWLQCFLNFLYCCNSYCFHIYQNHQAYVFDSFIFCYTFVVVHYLELRICSGHFLVIGK